MKLIDRLERKFGRFGISNLTMYIVICYVLGYMLMYIKPELLEVMSLEPALILRGQIWRLVTWVIYPPSSGNFLLFAVSIVFFYSSAVFSPSYPFPLGEGGGNGVNAG